MTLSRRSLLTGLLSSAAVIAAGPVAKVIPATRGREVIYLNRTIRTFRDLQELEFIEGMAQRAVSTFIYGNPDATPRQFTGLTLGEPLIDIDGGGPANRSLWKIGWSKSDDKRLSPS